MKLDILYQGAYSRRELLLRTFFGLFYIALPHLFLLFFYSLYVCFLQMINFFYVLYSGRFSRRTFDAIVGLTRWNLRVSASMSNLVDGYPPFGPNAEWNKVNFSLGYPVYVRRRRMLFITLFGSLVTIPHIIVLYFRSLIQTLVMITAFFMVLITKKYPEELHKFSVNTLRYQTRIEMYLNALYFQYPEFDGNETVVDKLHA